MSEQIQKPVQNQLNSSSVAEAFANAEESIYTITEMPEFADSCAQLGLDPIKSTNTAAYWDVVSEFALRDIDERSAKGDTELELTAYELTALTPSFLYATKALHERAAKSASEHYQLARQVSYYNGLIRYLGYKHDVKASEIIQSAENVASIAGLTDQASSLEIKQTVRGAQHELAFGQILDRAGLVSHDAPIEMDIRGVDYIVQFGSHTLQVDVKASLSQIEALGRDKSAFAIEPPRHAHEQPTIMMYSLIKDSELNGSFHIDDSAAAEKAPVLLDLLNQADQQAAA